MKQKIYHVDTFADKVFSGNPAAVCPLVQWPEDALMQQIAKETILLKLHFI
jgi:predicted PhzF superfamily epimerase YddE/YHI9